MSSSLSRKLFLVYDTCLDQQESSFHYNHIQQSFMQIFKVNPILGELGQCSSTSSLFPVYNYLYSYETLDLTFLDNLPKVSKMEKVMAQLSHRVYSCHYLFQFCQVFFHRFWVLCCFSYNW